MTKDEALKLVLDVLVEINKLSIGENAICLPAEIDTAMDAAKEVLAQPPEERNFCPRCGKRAGKNAWDVHTCSLPEEEKIASFQEVDGGGLLDGIEKLRALRDSEWAQSRDIDGEIRALRGHDDRTTPPQRTWVGLTDEDIKAVNAQVSQIPPIDYTTTTYAKAIEAKLKEKNR